MVAGVLSYFKNSAAPRIREFTFKAMVVRTLWPGATATEVEQQLTERLEKKLQETPWVDVIRSSSRNGESPLFIVLKDYAEEGSAGSLVSGAQEGIRRPPHAAGRRTGPFLNDEFGDTFVSIYALAGDGFGDGELPMTADQVARELRRADAKKVELIGGAGRAHLRRAFACQTGEPGTFRRGDRRCAGKTQSDDACRFLRDGDRPLRVRVSSALESVAAVSATPIVANGRTYRLGDIAR